MSRSSPRLRDRKLPFWFFMDKGPPKPISPPVLSSSSSSSPDEGSREESPPPPPRPLGRARGRGRGIMAHQSHPVPGGPPPLSMKQKVQQILVDFPQSGLTLEQLKERWASCYPAEPLVYNDLFRLTDTLDFLPGTGSDFFIKLRHPPSSREAAASEEFGSWEKELDGFVPLEDQDDSSRAIACSTEQQNCSPSADLAPVVPDPTPSPQEKPTSSNGSASSSQGRRRVRRGKKQSPSKGSINLVRGIYPLVEAPPFSKFKLPSGVNIPTDVWEKVYSILFHYGKDPDWIRIDTLCGIYGATQKGLPEEFSSGKRTTFFSYLQEWVRFKPDPTGSFWVQMREEPLSFNEITSPMLFDTKTTKIALKKHKHHLIAKDEEEVEEWEEELLAFSDEFARVFPLPENQKLAQFKAEVYWLILNHFPEGMDSSQLRQAYFLKYQQNLPEEMNSKNMNELLPNHCSDVIIFDRKSPVHGMAFARLDLPLKLEEALLKRLGLLGEYQSYQNAPTGTSEAAGGSAAPMVVPLVDLESDEEPKLSPSKEQQDLKFFDWTAYPDLGRLQDTVLTILRQHREGITFTGLCPIIQQGIEWSEFAIAPINGDLLGEVLEKMEGREIQIERHPPPGNVWIRLKEFENRLWSNDFIEEELMSSREESLENCAAAVEPKTDLEKELQTLTEEERTKLSEGFRILRIYAKKNRGGIWLMDFPPAFQLEKIKNGSTRSTSFDKRLLRLLAAEAEKTPDFDLTYDREEGEFGILVKMKPE